MVGNLRSFSASSGGKAQPQYRTPDNQATTPLGKSRLRTDRIIDLTHSFDRGTIYWPTEAGFKLIRGPAGITEKGYYYAANRFVGAEHGGTHIDAPIHFFKEGNTVDQIPLEKLVGEAVVVDVARACAEDCDYQVDVEDLRRWETNHNRQLIDVIVLLRTGYGRRWSNRESYLGTSKTGPSAVADLHFPGLAPAAARWLIEHRAIKAIGIDSVLWPDRGSHSLNILVYSRLVPGTGLCCRWRRFRIRILRFR